MALAPAPELSVLAGFYLYWPNLKISTAMPEPYLLPAVIECNRLMAASFLRLVGRPLIAAAGTLTPEALAEFLYDAPFVLLAHTNAADPIFCYANRRAQELFGYGWDEFTRLPSRLSAEPVSQRERQRLLEQARIKGYVDTYQGIRIARDGRRFRIENVILWDVLDDRGNFVGQAAVFDRWTDLP
jgi:PAS domain-containing protein